MKVIIGGTVLDMPDQTAQGLLAQGVAVRYEITTDLLPGEHTKPFQAPRTKETGRVGRPAQSKRKQTKRTRKPAADSTNL